MLELLAVFELITILELSTALPTPLSDSNDNIGRTPVAIHFDQETPPTAQAMQGWFIAKGKPRTVLEVEDGPAEIVVVRDPATQHYLDLLAEASKDRDFQSQQPPEPEPPQLRQPAALARSPKLQQTWTSKVVRQGKETSIKVSRSLNSTEEVEPSQQELADLQEALRVRFSLGKGARLRFVSAQAAPVSRTARQMQVFNMSHGISTAESGFLAFVPEVPAFRYALRFFDALALAGQELHTMARRRAIVVLVEGLSVDESLNDAEAVRDFLASLQVPVFVWTFAPGPVAQAWDGCLITTQRGSFPRNEALDNFIHATTELRHTLDKQRIVWIEGRHRPDEIRLSDDARGIRLAGETIAAAPLAADEPARAAPAAEGIVTGGASP